MPRYNEPPTAMEMELMTREEEMRKYRICPDCGWQWWVDATCSTASLHKCKNGNMITYPEPSPHTTKAHPNPVLRTILNNYFRGIYNQEETINLILKEVGYGVSISGGGPCKDGAIMQTVQPAKDDAQG